MTINPSDPFYYGTILYRREGSVVGQQRVKPFHIPKAPVSCCPPMIDTTTTHIDFDPLSTLANENRVVKSAVSNTPQRS